MPGALLNERIDRPGADMLYMPQPIDVDALLKAISEHYNRQMEFIHLVYAEEICKAKENQAARWSDAEKEKAMALYEANHEWDQHFPVQGASWSGTADALDWMEAGLLASGLCKRLERRNENALVIWGKAGVTLEDLQDIASRVLRARMQ